VNLRLAKKLARAWLGRISAWTVIDPDRLAHPFGRFGVGSGYEGHSRLQLEAAHQRLQRWKRRQPLLRGGRRVNPKLRRRFWRAALRSLAQPPMVHLQRAGDLAGEPERGGETYAFTTGRTRPAD
jgi:hypothetical protein